MSTLKNLRKRPRLEFRKSVGIEEVNATTDLEQQVEVLTCNEPIITPHGNTLYSCQYCNKTFPQKLTSISHMSKCPKNIEESILRETKLKLNNNEIDRLSSCRDEENSNNSNGKDENNLPASEGTAIEKVTKNDVSIYDYDEQDSDDLDLNEDGEENSNNRQCKHCKALFDTPLEMLRHSRDCHSFSRKVLSLDEIEKYFDYPNRQFCPICEKPIKTRNFRSVFIKHLLVHTTGLTHECTVCKKKFRRRDHMRAHERRHVVM